MEASQENRYNYLKKLISSDRRRRSFLCTHLKLTSVRLSALLKTPEHLTCLEAMSFCAFYQIHPEPFYELLLGHKGYNDFRRMGKFNFTSFYSSNYSTKYFWNFIETLKSSFAWSDEKIASVSGLELSQYHYYAGRWRDFPFIAGMRLAQTLKEDLLQFHDEKFDIDAYIKRRGPMGNSQAYLPARFEVGAGSKMRLLENALDYLSARFGKSFSRFLLRSIEFSEGVLRFKDKNISILTFKELHRKAIALGGDPLIPFYLGKNNQNNQANRTMFRQYMKMGNYRELYQSACIDVAPLVDRNFHYEVIDSSPNFVRIRARAQAERHKALGENFLDRNMALYIYGHYIIAPCYLDGVESKPDFSTFIVDSNKAEFYFDCHQAKP